MAGRISFIAITVFWVVMNVLLWRAEFGRGRETLSDVNPATVIDRLLNAPDAPIGTLDWRPSVMEGAAGAEPGSVPEGMVDTAGYSLDADLLLTAEQPTDRWRVLSHLELDTNKVWKEWTINVQQRPAMWRIVARQGEDEIVLSYEAGKESWEKRFSLRDLANPRTALGPYALLLPGPLAQNLGQFNADSARQSFQWRASNDWLRVGNNRVRVYRLSASLFANYEMVVYLSRAGEVLKVQLPDTFVLVNRQLPALRKD
jgi:hypothetical protein